MSGRKIKQQIRDRLLAKIALVDFAAMTKEEYGDWINALPPDEFISLISLHGEFVSRELEEETAPADAPPAAVPHSPDDNAWIPYDGNGTPVHANKRVWVMFRDGDTSGPNPAHMFLWDETGTAQILAYAPVSP